MIVLRIEHKDGVGPYRTIDFDGEIRSKKICKLADEICSKHNYGTKYPSARLIYAPKPMHNYVCGFTSVFLMKKWFAGFWRKLNKVGYKVAIYDVPVKDVYCDDHQCIFIPETGELIEKLPIFTRQLSNRTKDYLNEQVN